MTTPKIQTVYDRGSRFYVNPGTGEKVPGVTSVLNMLSKPFLQAWSAKMVAISAVESGPAWLEAMIRTQGEQATVDFLKGAPKRSTQEAADTGSAAHGVFEAMCLGKPVGKLTDTVEPFRRQYQNLLDTIQPEVLRTEDAVWSDTHNYAGSFDLLAKVDGRICWIDNKTTRSGVYPEVALQLSAYSHADMILDDEGGAAPMPADAKTGLVFWVRPDFWQVFEVPIGDEVFNTFLALRKTFDWSLVANRIVGRPLVKGGV